MNETTATALAYGIYKTDLPESDAVNVAFVDMGHASTELSVVAFKKSGMVVKAHAWDRDLGGRDLDDLLFGALAAEFKVGARVCNVCVARVCVCLMRVYIPTNHPTANTCPPPTPPATPALPKNNRKAKSKLDIRQNAKACFKLRLQCEKLKKTLSANPEAPINVECLMDDVDFRAHVTRCGGVAAGDVVGV